jgi:hypothetical protein
MFFKYILKVLIIIFIIFSVLLFVKTHVLDFYIWPISISNSMIECFNANTQQMDDASLNNSDSFCKTHKGSSGNLEKSCGNLTQNNCNSTSCCVWTSNNKCVAGNADGPKFNSDKHGKTKDLDYYYFKGQCYGDNCS